MFDALPSSVRTATRAAAAYTVLFTSVAQYTTVGILCGYVSLRCSNNSNNWRVCARPNVLYLGLALSNQVRPCEETSNVTLLVRHRTYRLTTLDLKAYAVPSPHQRGVLYTARQPLRQLENTGRSLHICSYIREIG